jgi:hypothetical protein
VNRQTYPATQAPLTGDISGPAGATQVAVVGIRGIPVSSATPTDMQLLRFIAANGDWEPSNDGNTAIYLNGFPVSDDYLVYVNPVTPIITVNGV